MAIRIKQVNGQNVELKAPVKYIKPTGTIEINDNGLHNVTDYGYANVEIEKGITPSGTINITKNGKYDTTTYAEADVNIETKEPTGTKEITTNGNYDVKDFANANVNVPTGITPSGTISITENGSYDITNFASAVVEVANTGGGGKYAPRHLDFSTYAGTELDYEVANVDTSNIKDFGEIFNNCTKLTQLNLSNWNMNNATSTYQMFGYCYALTKVDLSGFVGKNVTAMNNMFLSCSKLTEIILKDFNSQNVTSTRYAFSCATLQKLDIRSWGLPVSKLKDISYMFNNVPSTCLIIVKDQTAKNWVTALRSDLTNVKTLEEYQAEGGI